MDIEYKETEIFELFPKILYSPLQRKRVLTFHGYFRNARKMIRYASHFDSPDKVCLVYLVGEIKPELINKMLAESGCSDRVCVITAQFPKEAMEVWERYDHLRKQLICIGAWDKEKDRPSRSYLMDRKKLRDYYASFLDVGAEGQTVLFGAAEDYSDCQRAVSEYDELIETAGEYERIEEKSRKSYFKNFRLHRRGHLEKPYTLDRLDKLIQSIFPYGAEAMGANDYVARSPAAIKPCAEWALNGTENKKLNITEEMIAPAVKALRGFIHRSIEDKGYCSLTEIREVMSTPPFGLNADGYSAACVTAALKSFANRTMLYFDGAGHFELKGIEGTIFSALFGITSGRYKSRHAEACLYLESQPHKKVKQFMAKLWGIKVEMPGAAMGLHLARDLCREHRVPLAYVDERLLKLTLWNIDFWDKRQVSALADEVQRNGAEIISAYDRYKLANRSVPHYAASLLKADYSWTWNAEEYRRILFTTKKYGAWPWSNDIQNQARREWAQQERGT